MKKTILLLLLILSSISLQAQFTLTNYESGQQINDSDIITVSQSVETYTIIATNNFSYGVNLGFDVVSETNTDGSEVEICFGVNEQGHCYSGGFQPIVAGTHYDGGAVLNPGEHTGNSDIHIVHNDNGNGPYPKEYVFKIAAKDTSGNEVASVTFTYRYDPNANIIDSVFSKDEFNVISLSGKLQITNKQNLKISLFDLTGKKVKSLEISAGVNEINTSNFTKGLYIINASNRQKQITRKIIIK